MSTESDKPTQPAHGSSGGGPRQGPSRAGLAGRRIGPYRITDEIGKGGMGVVYGAEDTALARKVAIKVLPAHLGGDAEFMKRFVREARAAARLDHPNIVQVYQAGRMVTETGDGPCFIAMQFVEGEPLSELIRREGRLEPARALEIVKQVAEALGAAHAAGLIHRDIKSSNILVTPEGRVKVTDFGLATSMSSDRSKITETGAYLGTPEYSSPEQCEGLELDGRSDIYSLGVVLYEMLAGRVPFEARTPLKLFDKIVHEEPEALSRVAPGLPREVSALVSRMMDKNPARRFAGAEQLLGGVRHARAALGTWKRGVGTGRRRPVSGRFFSRRSALPLAVAAGLLLALGGLGLWFRSLDPADQPAPVGPVGPVGPVQPADAPVGVAFFELDNPAGEKEHAWLALAVPTVLAGKLRDLPGLTIYPREAAAQALRETGGRDHAAAARRLGARLAITGQYLVAPDGIRVDVQVRDVAAATALAEAVSVRGTDQKLLSMIDQIGTELRSRLGSVVSGMLGRPANLAAAELRKAEECMFLAAAPAPVMPPAPAPGKGGPGGQPEAHQDPVLRDEKQNAPAGASGAKSDREAGGPYGGGRGAEGAPAEAERNLAGEPKSAVGLGAAPQDKRPGAGAARPAEQSAAGAPPAAKSQPPAAATPAKPAGDGTIWGAAGKDAGLQNAPPAPAPAPAPTAPDSERARRGLLGGKEADRKAELHKALDREAAGGAGYRRGAAERRAAPVDEAVLSEALRLRFEAESAMRVASSRSEYSEALAKLANSRALAENQVGLEQLIMEAKAAMATAGK